MKVPLLGAMISTLCLGLQVNAGEGAGKSASVQAMTIHAAKWVDRAQNDWLTRRYELVARVSTSRRCLTVTAKGDARNPLDSLEIGMCQVRRVERSESASRPAMARIEVSTHLLPPAAGVQRGWC